MKRFLHLCCFLTALSLSGCATDHKNFPGNGKVASARVAPKMSVNIFMAGDSTMSIKPLFPAQPERGWGQLLPLYFKEEAKIRNFARNGRSSKSFRDEGRWQMILDQIQPGDFVIIQFAHNDEKKADPARFTEPFGSFKENLERFIREARVAQAKPILATPIARRSFTTGGELKSTHGEYSAAIRQVATEQKVPLLELEQQSEALLKKLGAEPSKKLFMWCEPGEWLSIPEGRKDDTHLNAFGASRICDLAVEEIRAHVPELIPRLVTKPGEKLGVLSGTVP